MGGFPTRPCGQACQDFLHTSTSNSVSLLLPFVLHSSSKMCITVFLSVPGWPQRSVCISERIKFFLHVYFLPLFFACCGEKTKTTGSFILLSLNNYSLLITQTQLGLQHSINNQASDITSCDQTRQAHHSRSAERDENTKRNKEVLGWKQLENNTAGLTS